MRTDCAASSAIADWSSWAVGRGHRKGRAENPCPRKPNRGNLPAESGSACWSEQARLLDARIHGTSVSWGDALWFESLGQAIRGADLCHSRPLGVRKAAYLLLAPPGGLTPRCRAGMSLAKPALRRRFSGPAGEFFICIIPSQAGVAAWPVRR